MGNKLKQMAVASVGILFFGLGGCQQPTPISNRQPAKIVTPFDKTCVLNLVDTGAQLLSQLHYSKITAYVEMGKVIAPLALKGVTNQKASLSQFTIGQHQLAIEKEGNKCYLTVDHNLSEPIKCNCIPIGESSTPN